MSAQGTLYKIKITTDRDDYVKQAFLSLCQQSEITESKDSECTLRGITHTKKQKKYPLLVYIDAPTFNMEGYEGDCEESKTRDRGGGEREVCRKLEPSFLSIFSPVKTCQILRTM